MVVDEILLRVETLDGESADHISMLFSHDSPSNQDTVSVRSHDSGRPGNGVANFSRDSNIGLNLGHLLSGEER